MSHMLVSFLGRGGYSPDGKRLEYRTAKYGFFSEEMGGEWVSPNSKYFAYAAYLFHRDIVDNPFDKVVILGTPGSMWDALADSFGRLGPQAVSDVVLRLVDAVDSHQVTQEQLDEYARELTEHAGHEIVLKLIPPAADIEGQADILHHIMDCVKDRDSVWLDVTHGYRHLPMIGLAAATIAATIRNATMEEIAYGALDMTRNGVTPVVSLVWILQLFRVLNGLNEFSRRQSLRPLIECFPSGAERNALELAAFKLNVMRIDEAATAVRGCLKQLRSSEVELPVELELVGETLRGRLAQFSHQQRTMKGLASMAKLALEEEDFLRTAIYLFELVELADDQGIPGDDGEDWKLRSVRNWLVHAGQLSGKKKVRKTRTFEMSRDSKVRRKVRGELRRDIESRKHLRQFFQKQIERLQDEHRKAGPSDRST